MGLVPLEETGERCFPLGSLPCKDTMRRQPSAGQEESPYQNLITLAPELDFQPPEP